MRFHSILRERGVPESRDRGKDHQHWRNRHFNKAGLFCLLDAREVLSLRPFGMGG
jgi:hypothetical protein